MSDFVLLHSNVDCDISNITMLKKYFIVWNILMLCFYIRCYRRLCGREYLEICLMHSPVDILYIALFSLLLLWSCGWLRWIRSYYGTLEQKYSVLRHCTGNTCTVEYLPATQLCWSGTESLLSTDRRETKDNIFMHQFQCLLITSDSNQSTIRPQWKILFIVDIPLWYVNSKEEAQTAIHKEVLLQHPSEK
jgi:hypothetical protein